LPAWTPEQVFTKQPADPAQSQSASTPAGAEHHRVVVVGGGFAGLEAVKGLRGAAVDVTLVDRNNYHLFQPLTYRVATGTLSPDEIAEPLRAVSRRQRRVRVVMAEVTGLDLERRLVILQPAVDGAAPRTTRSSSPADPGTRISDTTSGVTWHWRSSRWTARCGYGRGS
jgi:NADPH-dependent 2,4-dienoyl-CoA reductase/sulfur reductase-like enzyme